MKVVGITGGIGSGKSTVSKIFQLLGIPVFNSDEAGRYLLANNEAVKQKVIHLFGKEVVQPDGQLSRSTIAALVFNNQSLLNELNAIIHPAVQTYFEDWKHAHSKAPFVLKETAILFESGTYRQCQKIITVIAPESLRVQRAVRRDGMTEEAVKARMHNQWSDEKKAALSDFVIQNDEQVFLVPQVISVYQAII